jgi:serine phosphatase RsbU (regulator of sigma subunit)
LDEEQTQIVTTARALEIVMDERVHCLEVVAGAEVGRRYMIGRGGATLGRAAPADIILADSEVSRMHCRLAMLGAELVVADLNSTNGVFVDGERIDEATVLAVGSILHIGQQSLKHEWRTRREILQSDELDRELAKADSYVKALLPAPLRTGPIRADWLFQPCAKLGGDAFGYGDVGDGRFAVYLMDVSGHGAGAAMHSVAVMNVLRQRALPGADMAKPAEVLATLNAMFPMESHADMYFTFWYGVFDPATRRLEFASAGHHPAFLARAEGGDLVPLRTRNPMIGGLAGRVFTAESVEAPPGSVLYLFSDGVFEIVTIDGLQWGLQDFLPLIRTSPSADGLSECQRLHQEVARAARPGGLDDDFSLLVLTFD